MPSQERTDQPTTPLMKQYMAVKSKYPDTILLYRVGDFYETFGQDAIKTSEILGITLTRKANGSKTYTELAGFPFHAVDTYLPRLVRAGQKVAVCEQLEDPKSAKGIVKRGIIELVTPGVAISDQVLENRENNFLACVHFSRGIQGLALLDFSTGEFYISQGSVYQIEHWLSTFSPKEVLVESSNRGEFQKNFGSRYYTTTLEDWAFVRETALESLNARFGTQSLKGFGIEDENQGVVAAGAILQYLKLTHHDRLSHISGISQLVEEGTVFLDKFSIRNLELLYTPTEGGVPLIKVLDRTRSAMGSRLLKRWMVLPLCDIQKIRYRQDAVKALMDDEAIRESLKEEFSTIQDLERLSAKLSTERISPREMNQLKLSILSLRNIKNLCQSTADPTLCAQAEGLDACEGLPELIGRTLREDAPVQIVKGQVIAEGVNEELDHLRRILSSGKDYLLELQQREIERTGISSLKVAYNGVFGYYIEVRNIHKDKVPQEWIRKQTLVNAERYITEELKDYESQILGAEEKILQLESSIYADLLAQAIQYLRRIQTSARYLAEIDVFCSYADSAIENNYCRPLVDDSDIIDIHQGRHPVIEAGLPDENPYIPNDVYLDTSTQQIMVITGPNMSGKSALLRQTAIIVLMAQMGSCVPAKEARIGMVDRIFTRVGASDNISQGESTFMVEMIESASILNNITPRSLVLLDEIGRGTSTYDGISIAWAMVEFLHEMPKARAKTLFATHYHELNEMEGKFERVRNYHISIKESGSDIIFLRQLARGGSEHSFGIHVARIAGMPKSVVSRAEKILSQLEAGRAKDGIAAKDMAEVANNREGYQLSFFQLDDPALYQIKEELSNIDINLLTPLEAMNKLNAIKAMVGGSKSK